MKTGIKFLLVFFILFAISCKKDKDTDTVTTQIIHGQVYNLCTDSGLVNCTVFLIENGSTLAQMSSGVNGNFTFSNVQIHSSSSYSYSLKTIDNPDGGNGLPPISGDATNLDKGNLNQIYKLQVIPLVLQWFLYYPKGTVVSYTSNDTLLLTLHQKIFHKNFPSGNYLLTLGNAPTYTSSSTSNFIGDLSFEWMGWWYSTLSKTKNGVHTVKTDSFYVGWNKNVTDTIPW
jgi:hypothetical protein